ncbi:hypothetical protein [Trinickia sp.]|uniref:hypothetical protein n=1 Tax=Trinickia sp. TaxID=2571163 RepID=UPI003F7F312A
MSQDPISRTNYFSGEALSPDDFRAEQRFHARSREQLSNGVCSPGIVEGLHIQWVSGATGVTVTAGKALDPRGRLIVLTQDTPCAFELIDGRQNFLTIGYSERLTDLVAVSYGQGYKRCAQEPVIACGSEYDPDGYEILLAVIDAAQGVITNVAYSYGAYMRRHVSTALRSAAFVDERNRRPWPAAGIGLNGATLEIEAPRIKLNGAVTAGAPGNRIAGGMFSGTFEGTFTGDGTGLTLPPTSGWTRDQAGNLSYSEGKVTVGDGGHSNAYLTVRQGTAPAKIGTGLISLQADAATVWGYQTRFLSEVQPGDTLIYDYAPEQSAMIDHVISPTQLVLANRFPIDLGPSTYATQRKGQSAKTGNGKVSACGTTLTCIDGKFPTDLAAGDTIVLDASRENAPVSLRVRSVSRDDLLMVTVVQGAAAQSGPKLSAFSVMPSTLLEVGGVVPPDSASPPALVVAMNGAGATPANSVAINRGGAGGSYALDVNGPVLLEDDVQMSKTMQVDGDLTVDGDLAVAGSLTVNHTTHAVTAQKDMQVVGNLTVGGALNARNAKTTLQSVALTGDAKIDGTVTANHLAGYSVKYFGARTLTSYTCPANSASYTPVSGETVRADGILTVQLNTIAITCDQGFAGTLLLAFDGADAAMANYVSIWSVDAITASNRSNEESAASRTLMVPLKTGDEYKIVFRSNGKNYAGVKVNVMWTPLGG